MPAKWKIFENTFGTLFNVSGNCYRKSPKNEHPDNGMG